MTDFATCPKGHRHEVYTDRSGNEKIHPIIGGQTGRNSCVYNNFVVGTYGIRKEVGPTPAKAESASVPGSPLDSGSPLVSES